MLEGDATIVVDGIEHPLAGRLVRAPRARAEAHGPQRRRLRWRASSSSRRPSASGYEPLDWA